jgi:helicase
VNLPGKRVVIRDYKRYGSLGMEPIPVMEIHQMFGRAGRPKYDTEGEAILIANTLPEFENLWDHYIEGTPEPITSKLGVEPILRMHTLGLISQTPITKEQLLDFFARTFYAYKYSNLEGIENILNTILDQLFKWGFLDYDKNNRFKCTLLGTRIAQLYIDPLTAHDLIELLSKKLPDDLVLLTILSDTAEMRPLAAVRRSEELELYEQFEKLDLEEEQVRAFKNAFIFFEWMNEITDDKIYDKYNMPPGTFRNKLNITDWLLYACSEIARIQKREKIIPKVNNLRKRLKYGVKKELLPLVRVRNIGRVRARKLYNSGIKNIEAIKKTDSKTLTKLLGEKTSKKVSEQLDLKFEKEKKGLEKYVKG